MRARDLYIVGVSLTSAEDVETLPINANTGFASIASSFQAATSNKSSSPYGNSNMFVDSLTITGGMINGNFGKSSAMTEATDSIDAILLAARG